MKAKTILYGKTNIDVINSKDYLVPKDKTEINLPDSDKHALAIAINKNLPALLIGETGTGKTSVVREIAYLRKQAYVRVNMTGFTTPDELIGSKSVKNGATYFEHGIITDAMSRGAILVIDEINATTPDCLFILHGLLDEDRRITLPNGEVITPHKDFRVFATCNPDYEGTKSMNKAFLDRFPIILFINTLSPDLEKNLIEQRTGIDKAIAEKLVTAATMSRKNYTEGKISIYVSTRSLLSTASLIQHGLEPIDAYKTSIMQKTSNKDEQKVLLDFFLAVFKMSQGQDLGNEPIITTKNEMDKLNNEIKKLELEKKTEEGKNKEVKKENVDMKKELEEKKKKIDKLKQAVKKYNPKDELITPKNEDREDEFEIGDMVKLQNCGVTNFSDLVAHKGQQAKVTEKYVNTTKHDIHIAWKDGEMSTLYAKEDYFGAKVVKTK